MTFFDWLLSNDDNTYKEPEYITREDDITKEYITSDFKVKTTVDEFTINDVERRVRDDGMYFYTIEPKSIRSKRFGNNIEDTYFNLRTNNEEVKFISKHNLVWIDKVRTHTNTYTETVEYSGYVLEEDQ